MPEITIDLIRRKAEHNEGLIHTLEELSLHQEEIESINETLGCNCRRLKILYLQNNIIGEMRNLHHMKELEYLNLAVNNITKVRGLHSCEFLDKLDLTVNFVDLDELESSVGAMEGNKHLKDLYMMGNPCQSWPGFELYVIARLPQLERLDGKEITRTDRIRAVQRLPSLCQELAPLAEEVRRRKRDENTESEGDDPPHGSSRPIPASEAAKASEEGRGGIDGEAGRDDVDHPLPAPDKKDEESQEEDGRSRVIGDKELTKHTPEVRTSIYREMAEQKREKEERRRENLPKDRNFDAEQEEAVARARTREAEGVIRQCNEGKLDFRFKEMTTARGGERQAGRRGGGDTVVLEVSVPRYLDSSLIDLDVHPHYVSVVIKGKVLRLSLPTEVKADDAKARRSKTTGSLVVTMPKVDPLESLGLLPAASGGRRISGATARANDIASSRTKRRSVAQAPTLATMMIEEAKAAQKRKEGNPRPTDPGDSTLANETLQKAVSIRGIVGPRHGGIEVEAASELREVATSKRTSAYANDRRMDSHGDSRSVAVPDDKA